jgi:hypothetical protein
MSQLPSTTGSLDAADWISATEVAENIVRANDGAWPLALYDIRDAILGGCRAMLETVQGGQKAYEQRPLEFWEPRDRLNWVNPLRPSQRRQDFPSRPGPWELRACLQPDEWTSLDTMPPVFLHRADALRFGLPVSEAPQTEQPPPVPPIPVGADAALPVVLPKPPPVAQPEDPPDPAKLADPAPPANRESSVAAEPAAPAPGAETAPAPATDAALKPAEPAAVDPALAPATEEASDKVESEASSPDKQPDKSTGGAQAAKLPSPPAPEPARKRITPNQRSNAVKAMIQLVDSGHTEIEAARQLAPRFGYGDPESLARLYRKHHRKVRTQMVADQRISADKQRSSARTIAPGPGSSALRKNLKPGRNEKP